MSIPAGWYPQPDGHIPAGWYPRLPAGWYPRLPASLYGRPQAGWNPRLPAGWYPRLPAGWKARLLEDCTPQPAGQGRDSGGELRTEHLASGVPEATTALTSLKKEHFAAAAARRIGVADSLGWGGLAVVVLIGALSLGISGATMMFGLFALVVGERRRTRPPTPPVSLRPLWCPTARPLQRQVRPCLWSALRERARRLCRSSQARPRPTSASPPPPRPTAPEPHLHQNLHQNLL